ncbi:phage replisome organizer N-terminal domain-containing protein [Solibacillus silvestris]
MAETKKYYWLKLKEDFFKDKSIKKMRKIAGGDTYTIIYLKLMLLGIKDEGKLFFEGVEDTFADEIALELDEDVENVKVTLMYLLKMGLLQEVNEAELFLTRVPECVGKETSKAELMRKKRARDKAASIEDGNIVTALLPPVTNRYTEIEKEKEIEKRKKREDIDYQLIADMYNEICISYPSIRTFSDARKKAIKARINSGFTINTFKELFIKAEKSTFLKGGNNKNWSATFDWMIKDANAAKILDGNYDDKNSVNNHKAYGSETVEINGVQYIKKNGQYYIPNGSGVAVNPYAENDLDGIL